MYIGNQKYIKLLLISHIIHPIHQISPGIKPLCLVYGNNHLPPPPSPPFSPHLFFLASLPIEFTLLLILLCTVTTHPYLKSKEICLHKSNIQFSCVLLRRKKYIHKTIHPLSHSSHHHPYICPLSLFSPKKAR